MSDIINPNAPTDEIVARLLQFADQTDHYATPSIWRIAAYRLQKTERERAALAEAAKRKMEEPWRAKVDRLYTHCNDPDQRTLWSKSDIIELVESAIRIPPETPPAQGKEESIPISEWTTRYTPEGPCVTCGKPILGSHSTHSYAGMKAHIECNLPESPKENTCSDESQGGGVASVAPSDATTGSRSVGSPVPPKATSATSSTSDAPAASVNANPPAWATPNILAACGPGERLYKDGLTVAAYPSQKLFYKGEPSGTTKVTEAACIRAGDECYTIPTPPAAKCDGSGTIKWDTGGPAARCPGCTACKPEPKDGAEEVVGPGVYYFGPDGTGAGNGTAIDITPNPRADREKQAARPARNMTTEEMAKILDHRSDVSNDLFAAIARRLRLLNALARAVNPDGRPEVEEARLALDADERGGKDGK